MFTGFIFFIRVFLLKFAYVQVRRNKKKVKDVQSSNEKFSKCKIYGVCTSWHSAIVSDSLSLTYKT